MLHYSAVINPHYSTVLSALCSWGVLGRSETLNACPPTGLPPSPDSPLTRRCINCPHCQLTGYSIVTVGPLISVLITYTKGRIDGERNAVKLVGELRSSIILATAPEGDHFVDSLTRAEPSPEELMSTDHIYDSSVLYIQSVPHLTAVMRGER